MRLPKISFLLFSMLALATTAGLFKVPGEVSAAPPADGLAAGPATLPAAAATEPRVVESIDVAPVWAGHPVGFCLLTASPSQYVAYYDKDRHMTVAKRDLGSNRWHLAALVANRPTTQPASRHDPVVLGWDSHNSVTLALDGEGNLHVSGNMHVDPLVYFRTTRAGDVDSCRQVPHMIGDREDRCTYPRFLHGPAGELIFAYRDGRSGSGADLYNVYDPAAHAWRRLLDTPLTDGLGEMNAYCIGPVRGPDGFFHLCWVWRNSSDCSSDHDLSYARSKDLRHWESGDGMPLNLPITPRTGEVVDPVPVKGGIINGNTLIGFDSDRRVVLSYHKYDAAGKTQIFNARHEAGGWKIVRASDWDYRWEFSGGGSIHFDVGVGAVQPVGAGRLVQVWRNAKDGGGAWLLDEQTLKPLGRYSMPPQLPRELAKPESDLPGMRVKIANDSGASDPRDPPGTRYVLRWETLPPNRDQPRPGSPPPPSMLRVYKIASDAPAIPSLVPALP